MWEIYLISRLTAIQTVFFAFAFISGLIFAFFVVVKIAHGFSCRSDDYNYAENQKIMKRMIGIFCPIFIVTMIGAVMIPNTKEAALIYVGGNVVEYIEGNEKIKELPDKVVNIADEYLNELASMKSN